MFVNRLFQTEVIALSFASVILLNGSPADGQTAACCLGNECQVLDEVSCGDQSGQWFGELDPPIVDCTGDPCLNGACCFQNGACTNDWTLTTCLSEGNTYWFPFQVCSTPGSCPGPANDACENAEPACQDVCRHPTDNTLSSRWSCETTADCPAPDECLPLAPDPDNGYCDNDDLLDDGPVCSQSAQDCYDGSLCRPYPDGAELYRCFFNKDNRLATTDGPPTVEYCSPGLNAFQADVWHKITAPCAGILVADDCRSQFPYDEWLAILGDGTADYADTACPVTTNSDMLMCNDDFCPGSATVSAIQTYVVKDATYLLRTGGFSAGGTTEDANQGKIMMNLGFICPLPPPAFRPDLPVDPTHQARKNRYLSIDPNNDHSVALELRLDSMRRCSGDDRRACRADSECPGVCDNNHDLQCVDDDICAGGACVPTAPCVQHANVGNVIKYVNTPYTNSCSPLDDCADQWFANLVATPVYRIWTEDTIHIAGCEIVPAAIYKIRGTPDGTEFGAALTIGTTAKPNVYYGDCVGPVVDDQFTTPDGFSNVTDIQAFLAAQTAAPNAPHTTWVDLHGLSATRICDPPTGACIVPQQVLNVADLQTIKFGFLGQTYVETPGHENPGDCP